MEVPETGHQVLTAGINNDLRCDSTCGLATNDVDDAPLIDQYRLVRTGWDDRIKSITLVMAKSMDLGVSSVHPRSVAKKSRRASEIGLPVTRVVCVMSANL